MGQVLVKISTFQLARILEEGKESPGMFVKQGLPPGTTYVRCFDEPTIAGRVCLVFDCPKLPEVQDGAEIPERILLLWALGPSHEVAR